MIMVMHGTKCDQKTWKHPSATAKTSIENSIKYIILK